MSALPIPARHRAPPRRAGRLRRVIHQLSDPPEARPIAADNTGQPLVQRAKGPVRRWTVATLVGFAIAVGVVPEQALSSPTVSASAADVSDAADVAERAAAPGALAGGAPSPGGGPLAPIFGVLGPGLPAFDLRHPDPSTEVPAVLDPAYEPSGAALLIGDIPATSLDAYRRAAAASPAGCGLDWALLASIGRVESDHGRFAGAVVHPDGRTDPPILGPRLDGTTTARITDTDSGRLDDDTTFDRAVGPMQFIPSTWATYGGDGNDDGTRDPHNLYDATAAAAAYLCASGGDLTTVDGRARAVYAYNHSTEYVATVLALAADYAGQPAPIAPPQLPAPVLPPVNPAPPLALPPVALPPVTALAGTPQAAPSSAPTTPPAASSSVGPTPTPVPTPAPSSAPPATASPTTTPPSTPEETAGPGTTSSTSTSTSTSTPPASSPTTSAGAPSTHPCATSTHLPTVADIADASGDPELVDQLTAGLLAAGTSTGDIHPSDVATSAVLYPDGGADQAGVLADLLGIDRAHAQAADVPRVRLVLGEDDGALLLAALTLRPPCPSPAAGSPDGA